MVVNGDVGGFLKFALSGFHALALIIHASNEEHSERVCDEGTLQTSLLLILFVKLQRPNGRAHRIRS